LVERVTYAMATYCLESHVDGTFFIQDRHGKVVRERLTAADEPNDIVDDMNARAAIAAMPSNENTEIKRLRSILRRCMGGANVVDLGNGEYIALYLEEVDEALK
jgi:hypothetical protein